MTLNYHLMILNMNSPENIFLKNVLRTYLTSDRFREKAKKIKISATRILYRLMELFNEDFPQKKYCDAFPSPIYPPPF